MVGNVEAYATITVIPRWAAQMTEVLFKEGDYVKKGQKLFHDRSAAARSAARAERGESGARQGAAGPGAGQSGARHRIEKYARAEAERYARLFDDRHRLERTGRAVRTNADTLAQSVLADQAAIESAKAQIAADEADYRQRQGPVELHHDLRRRSMADRQPDGEAGQRGLRESTAV